MNSTNNSISSSTGGVSASASSGVSWSINCNSSIAAGMSAMASSNAALRSSIPLASRLFVGSSADSDSASASSACSSLLVDSPIARRAIESSLDSKTAKLLIALADTQLNNNTLTLTPTHPLALLPSLSAAEFSSLWQLCDSSRARDFSHRRSLLLGQLLAARDSSLTLTVAVSRAAGSEAEIPLVSYSELVASGSAAGLPLPISVSDALHLLSLLFRRLPSLIRPLIMIKHSPAANSSTSVIASLLSACLPGPLSVLNDNLICEMLKKSASSDQSSLIKREIFLEVWNSFIQALFWRSSNTSSSSSSCIGSSSSSSIIDESSTTNQIKTENPISSNSDSAPVSESEPVESESEKQLLCSIM